MASPLRVPGFDEKILALYDKGMMTRDIQETVHERYGVEVSATLISEITAELGTEGGATVPEPSTLAAMLSMALAVLLVRAGRR